MRKSAPFFVLLGIVTAFHATTIRAGNPWGDDWALYILHARNLSSGLPYAETGYLYNPQVPQYGPRIYPPVFPLLLTPIYGLSGLNFWWMKLEQVAFLVLALGAICVLWRRDLPVPCMLTLLAVVGFNPHVWEMKDSVLSDLPFLFFFYAAVLVLTRIPRDRKWALLAGFAFYLAAGTRTIGIVLLAGLLLHDLLQTRRISMFSSIALAWCTALLLAQRFITGAGQGSYADQFHPTLAGIGSNTVNYARTLGFFWLGSSRLLALMLLSATCVLAGVGFRDELRRRRRLLPCLLAPYLLMVLLWPSFQGLRFLLPAVLYYLFLALAGLKRLTEHTRLQVAALGVLLAAVGFAYVQGFHRLDMRAIAEADGLLSFREFSNAVRSATKPNEALIFARPRTLALFSGRSASTYAVGAEDDLWRQIRSAHASYIASSYLFEEDRKVLIPFEQRHPDNFELIFHNQDFQLFRIRSPTPALSADAERQCR